MCCDRVRSYYRRIIDQKFVDHMIDDLGFTEEEKKLIRNLRSKVGNEEMFISESGLPRRKYHDVSNQIHVRMMDELFRLALIGYREEHKGHQ